jgi:hypothetical protein
MKKSKTKLNAEKRKLALKGFEKFFEQENNIYRKEYYLQKEKLDKDTINAFETATQVVEKTYPPKDVAQLMTFQKKYGDACNVVGKDSCFHFKVYDKEHNETETNYNGQTVKKELKKHFDFKLNGNLNGVDSYSSSNDGDKFAFAYYHDHLKQKDLMPNVLVKQGEKSGPYHTQHAEKCRSELGIGSESGISQQWKDKYALDVIGTSYCRTRMINIHREDFEILCDWQSSKQKLVSAYETWQKNNIDRLDLVEKTIKQYSTVDDVIELAKKIGFDLSERDLEIHSTEISFYNPNNVAQLLNDMKPKAKESRADKIARVKAYQQSVAVN